MIIYKDVISGDEIVSDSYNLKLIDDVIYEADCRRITVGGETFDVGGNPSAEGGEEEGVDDTSNTVIDIVHSFRLQTTSFDKKGYLGYLKGYMKKIKTHLETSGASEEEVTAFVNGAAAYVKKMVKSFNDYDFYVGESGDIDGMVVLLNYREDGITPYVSVWKHGLSEMKV